MVLVLLSLSCTTTSGPHPQGAGEVSGGLYCGGKGAVSMLSGLSSAKTD